jgi:hypothetical protein
MGIYEVLEMDEKLYGLVYHGADEEAIRDYLARERGFRGLREEGLRLVETGQSTLEEVLRVTHMETEVHVRAERETRAAEETGPARSAKSDVPVADAAMDSSSQAAPLAEVLA